MQGVFSLTWVTANFGVMSKNQAQIDLDELYKDEPPWKELWDGLLHFGLELFEPDGLCIAEDTGNSIGIECLFGLRTYFEDIELSWRAGHVHELIQEYQKRWPDAQPGNTGL